jgi:hypothetical protein
MNPSILTIDKQRLSTVISSYWLCKACGFASDDMRIARVGSPCSHCGSPSHGGVLFFPMGVHVMIDLRQEFYHLHPEDSHIHDALTSNHQHHRLAIIVFYCSLGELLLEHFLSNLMEALNLPQRIQDRLLTDVSIEKRLALFQLLTNRSFPEAVRQLDNPPLNDFHRVYLYYVEIRNKRNSFLHAGNPFAIDKSMPEQCLIDAPILITLFISLHNKFVIEARQEDARNA